MRNRNAEDGDWTGGVLGSVMTSAIAARAPRCISAAAHWPRQVPQDPRQTLVPNLRLGTQAEKLRFESASRARGTLLTRSGASRSGFPSGAWEPEMRQRSPDYCRAPARG